MLKGVQMSDRTVALTVVLDETYRVDDAEAIMNAIKMIKGVSTVAANVSDVNTYISYAKASAELEKKLFKILHDEREKR